MNDKQRMQWGIGAQGIGPEVSAPQNIQSRYFGRPNWLSARAQWLWDSAQALEGTPGQRYLQSQGIDFCPAELRYLSACPVGEAVKPQHYPAMIAALRNEEGLVAVELTFLGLEGHLANIARPKRLLGVPVGGLGRWGMAPQQILRLADSAKEAASAMVVGSHGIPIWPVFGCARYELIDIPAGISRIIIYARHNAETAAAIVRAKPHLTEAGRSLEIISPPGDESWNAYLQRVRSCS